MPITTFSTQTHRIEINNADKRISLFDRNACLMHADFKFDQTDSAAVLSHFESITGNASQNIRLLADITSTYLSTTPGPCKLFCFAGEATENAFTESKMFRSVDIQRLMLREKKILPKDLSNLPDGVRIAELNADLATENDKEALLKLLQQTYWAKDATLDYVNKALANSVLMVAYNEKNIIIGLVRYITNNHIAYISDMAVDEPYRKKNIATQLLSQALQTIDETHEFSALISAREGDGQAAGEKLYGMKFGFVDYDKQHQHTIQFAYIKNNPELTETVVAQSMFKPAQHASVPTASPLLAGKQFK